MSDGWDFVDWVRNRRLALGLTQSELAVRAGLTPGNISAIEARKRVVGDSVRSRLRQALAEYPSVLLDRRRAELLAAASSKGITDVRVFGSVANGTDRTDSDIDLLVRLPSQNALTAHIEFQELASRILTTAVDVLADHSHEEIVGRLLVRAREEALSL